MSTKTDSAAKTGKIKKRKSDKSGKKQDMDQLNPTPDSKDATTSTSKSKVHGTKHRRDSDKSDKTSLKSDSLSQAPISAAKSSVSRSAVPDISVNSVPEPSPNSGLEQPDNTSDVTTSSYNTRVHQPGQGSYGSSMQEPGAPHPSTHDHRPPVSPTQSDRPHGLPSLHQRLHGLTSRHEKILEDETMHQSQMVERHQEDLDHERSTILTNLVLDQENQYRKLQEADIKEMFARIMQSQNRHAESLQNRLQAVTVALISDPGLRERVWKSCRKVVQVEAEEQIRRLVLERDDKLMRDTVAYYNDEDMIKNTFAAHLDERLPRDMESDSLNGNVQSTSSCTCTATENDLSRKGSTQWHDIHSTIFGRVSSGTVTSGRGSGTVTSGKVASGRGTVAAPYAPTQVRQQKMQDDLRMLIQAEFEEAEGGMSLNDDARQNFTTLMLNVDSIMRLTDDDFCHCDEAPVTVHNTMAYGGDSKANMNASNDRVRPGFFSRLRNRLFHTRRRRK